MRAVVLLALALVGAVVCAGGVAEAGEGYTLFNPVPTAELRPMTTERSSKTDSPYSLDAGRFQLETNLYDYIYNNDCIGGVCTKTKQHIAGGSTNLRIGLTDRVDLQLIADIYRNAETIVSGGAPKDKRDGFGDTTVRLKINAFGNNPSDQYSLGIIPYIKLPSNQNNLGNDKIEGGIGLPFNVNFDQGWSVTAMTQLNLITDGADGYDPAFANSASLGKSFNDKLSGYLEFYTFKADQPGAKWLNTVDVGMAYMVTDRLRADVNGYFGVTDAADDANIFFGFGYRF